MSGYFSIDAKTGWITTSNSFPPPILHNSSLTFNLSVVARDNGAPSLVSSLLVIPVTIESRSRELGETLVSFFVDVEASVGTSIGLLRSTKAAIETNDLEGIGYFLEEDNSGGMFQIESETGKLLVSSPLGARGFSDRSNYSVIVLAVGLLRSDRDAGDGTGRTPTATASYTGGASCRVSWRINATVNVRPRTISTDSDHPQVTYSRVETIQENVPIGSVLFSIADPIHKIDQSDSALMAYSISSQSPPGRDWFMVNSSTGVVSIAASIDYEEVKQINLTIVTSVRNRQTATTFVFILVSDVNDNAPVIETDSEGVVMATVAEDAPVGSAVTRVLASDVDSRQNGRLRYAISSGNEAGCFALDPITG